MTFNHCPKILSTINANPGRFNNRHLVIFDGFFNKLKDEWFDEKHKFVRMDFDKDGKKIEVK